MEFLLQGISEFEIPSGLLASEVLIHGQLAFPIGTTDEGRAFLAGAYYGQGRVVVATHEGLLGRQVLFTSRRFDDREDCAFCIGINVPFLQEWASFWKSAIHWLDEGRQGVIGVSLDHALGVLQQSGLSCQKSGFRKDLSVFVCSAYGGDHAQEIQNFVAEGGGLLIGGHAWYWAQTNSGKNPLKHFAGTIKYHSFCSSKHEVSSQGRMWTLALDQVKPFNEQF